MGDIPEKVLVGIARQVVHRLAVGHADIDGDDFGTIFAEAIEGGTHLPSPIGLADVLWNGCAWSCKTVKANRPFAARRVRLISGRNSPDYSHGISDPHANPALTGRAVLSIWNSRVSQGMNESEDLRVVVLVRNVAAKEFLLFEETPQRFVPDDYEWQFNRNNNLEGRDKVSKAHHFTWQPHGSQFTIIRDVPGSARQFSIVRNVPLVSSDAILASIRFEESWVKINQ